MIGRDHSLTTAFGLIQSGYSVDVVGGRGSGRSAFLAALRSRLESTEWHVVSARGVASLRQNPLAALHLAGIGGSSDLRVGSPIQSTGDALREHTRNARSVLFIDDWDDLDEASWGVVESVRRTSGLPVVLSRLHVQRGRHTPSGLQASTVDPAFVVEMTPLRFDELEQVVTAKLGGLVEVGTMSRLYAKSGGVVGLAQSLLDAAARESRLEKVDGAWRATRDMWTPGLRGVVEAMFEGLDAEARDALELIALLGVADIETVRKLIDWPTLELLEERAMIRLMPTGGRQLITLVPPILVEYFRHEPVATRRIRLTEGIIEKLGSRDSVNAILASLDPAPEAVDEGDALFVRLLQERARTRRIVTHAEWVASPTPTTAVEYIRALLHTHSSSELVLEVFEGTDARSGDDLSRADFALLRAQWRAYVDHDLDGALDELRQNTRHLGIYARRADALAVVMENDLRGVPADFTDRLEISENDPPSVASALVEAQMAVLITLGRFDDARRLFDSIHEEEKNASGFVPSLLFGLVLLGQGDYAGALSWSLRGIDEAHGNLDADAVRAHSAVAVFCYTVAGDYEAAQTHIDTMFAVGDARPFPVGSQLGLLNLASIVAIRRGNVALGEKYAHELDSLPVPDGSLPPQIRAWSTAQLLAFNGQLREAADLLWEEGQRLWERGLRFAAVLMELTSVEIVENAGRTRIVAQHCEGIDDAFVRPYLLYIQARDSGDPEALAANVDALLKCGRPGLAASSLQLAANLWSKRGDEQAESDAYDRRARIIAEYGAARIDETRYRATPVNLSNRELEIARLVADGLANPEIATRLVLSVRTVESHMHRIMRKTNLASRQELAKYVEGLAR